MQLSIRNISKTYPNGAQALKDVTLMIPAGCSGCSGQTARADALSKLRILAVTK